MIFEWVEVNAKNTNNELSILLIAKKIVIIKYFDKIKLYLKCIKTY